MESLVFGLVCIAGFQIYSMISIHRMIMKLKNRISDLEDNPRKLRKIPKELDNMNWLTSALQDGTEICTINYVTQLNSDAMNYFNKIMNLLGSVHAQIYQPGTWIKTPVNDPASFRISWYKDLMKTYPGDFLEK